MRFIRDSILFGVVGVIGFFVDVTVLYSLANFMGLFYGRAISFFAAVLVTWQLNRRWTFQNRRSDLSNKKEFLTYLIFMLAGGAINYFIYAWLVYSYLLIQEHPIIAVAIGSLAGMFINFFTSRFILFRHQ